MDLNTIKLNTIELQSWLAPNEKVKNHCKEILYWEIFDKNIKNFFSIENKKNAFWENFKEYNSIFIKDIDWKDKEIKIQSIINWWMWTNVSSSNLVEAMNNIWFWWHLSSIWIWFYYYEELEKNFHQKDYKEIKNIIEKDFENIFLISLWLNENFIKKHFFECDDLWKTQKNKWFNAVSGKANIMRKMDLIALYQIVKDLKSNWNIVWLNSMYKTSSYIAMQKLASIIWIDYITTAAWNPETNPKIFLQDFYEETKKEGLKLKIPAYWLLISSSRILKDMDYDYYIFEEWKTAWWHIIRVWKTDKFNDFQKLKTKLNNAWKENTPIYAAWWIYSNEKIKEVFELWYDWIQLWTSLAVSEEAVNWKWENFKNRLISWNHLWENTKIDEINNKSVEKVEKRLNNLINIYNKKIIKFLDEKNIENIELEKIKNYLYKIIYSDFFDEEIKEEDLTDKEIKIIEEIKNFIITSYNWKEEKIYKVFRNYGNAKKFLKELEKFRNENNKNPSHLIFDSTVGFPWRTRITAKIDKVFSSKLESTWCISCLTDCILANRWEVKNEKWSTFCIYDWLDQVDKDKENIAFSWLSSTAYSKIRSVNDIMAFFIWSYIKRD